jgi:aquaporin Z
MIKRLTAEAFGTFALVFAGTAAITINEVSGGAVTHLGVSLTFGLIVLAMIFSLGDVSGAHINPAVTLAFYAARRFEGRMVFPYIASQCAGAVLASLTVWAMFADHPRLGSTIPAGSPFQSLALEFVMTLILMYVILTVSKRWQAAVAVGAVVALEALFGGPISGASMNPARSLAPALVSGHIEHLWVYFAGPILGALLAVSVCRCTREQGCCSQQG